MTAAIIAIDAMGGDHGVKSAIPGAALALENTPDTQFIFFGDEKQITKELENHPTLKNASIIEHTDKMVMNDDKPSAALRASKGTSMRLAIEAVEQGRAQSIVSSGNTGALMAMAKIVLKPLQGIHRPAIASVFPTSGSDTIMLDLGANVLVDAENLVQFAVLGSVFARAHKKVQTPTIGLLNVGSEETKGPDHVRGAYSILNRVEIPGRFIGFVEGNDIMTGVVDVIVSDGYAGNIALKAAEGVGKFSTEQFKKALTGDPLSMLGGLLASIGLKRFKNKVDPRRYNGGVFLGLNGLCIKSHGGADPLGFSSAVNLALKLSKQGYIDTVAHDINHLMSQESFLAEEDI